MGPEEAAVVIIEAATTDQPKLRWQTAAGAAALAGLSLADPDGSRAGLVAASRLT